MKTTTPATPGRTLTQAEIYHALKHYNLTEEEEAAYLPFSYTNFPQGMHHHGVEWRYTFHAAGGPELREVEGLQIVFPDGSKYRIADGWQFGEVVP